MALFGTKTKKTTATPAPAAEKKAVKKPEVKAVKAVKAMKAAAPKKAEKVAKAEKAVAKTPSDKVMTKVILRPRVTEKAGVMSEAVNAYTFEVEKFANKHTIAVAIKAQYKVTPIKINIVNLPSKTVFVRGKFGTKSGVKKAVVFLKKGDKIEIA